MVSIFTRSNIVLTLAAAFAGVSLAAAVACDTSRSTSEGATTTVEQPTTQVVEVDATTPDPAAIPATSAPRILWMAETHAGAGAITVDIETATPTRATISLFAARAGDTTQYPGPESDNRAATHHTISIGTGGVAGVVRAVVTDSAGKTATGELGTASRADAQFWALGTFAPTLSQQGLAATATWRTMNAPGATTATSGSAVLLSKQAGCTTAQACLPGSATLLGNDAAGITNDYVWDTHALSIDFPDGSHDYYLVLVGQRADGVTEFYQFDVAAASLRAS